MTPLHSLTEREWQERCPVEPRPFSEPRPGFFRVRLVPKGPWVPARIWTYRPRVAGTDHFVAHIAGLYVELNDVWHSGREITEDAYRELMRSPPEDPMQPVSRRRAL